MSNLGRDFECITLCPSMSEWPALALASARAGGVGALDIEFCTEDAAAWVEEQLRWLCDRSLEGEQIGVRLRPAQAAWVRPLVSELGARRAVLIFSVRPAARELEQLVRGALESPRVLVEVRSSAELAQLESEASRLDGVVACGNEAAGFVGEETSFILLQRALAHVKAPVYARGGIGLHGASACRAMGARGVVLDDQLLLLAESPLPLRWREQLREVTGKDTAIVLEGGRPCRVLDRPAFPALARAKARAERPLNGSSHGEAPESCVGWRSPESALWPIGQAVGLAQRFEQQFGDVGAVLNALFGATERAVALAAAETPLAEGSALARSHGTRFPIVQGPMTRVSDRAEFAHAVARAGALPLVALALLQGPDADALLSQTKETLGSAPWGVGILGFVPPELKEQQVRAVLRAKPAFALIAGGQPAQAEGLERAGIPTYLHTPTPALLRSFLTQGARRFVFEGRECGGHVGPLCSFPLWEEMIETLLECLPAKEAPAVHVLFAGGIHDARSSAAVAAMAAPLVARGVRAGVLMGTAYLFTEEAVSTGAITRCYQDQALACQRTVLLTSGLGHSNRVADTAYAEVFRRTGEVLRAEGKQPSEIRRALDDAALGRLRLASKGLRRNESGALVEAPLEAQLAEGVFMLGQVATLRERRLTMAQLHHSICEEGSALLREAARAVMNSRATPSEPGAVAIIGIATLLPGAKSSAAYFRNLLDKLESLRELPADRWDPALLADVPGTGEAPLRGGFFDDVLFDAARYRIPPNTMQNVSVGQLLGLELTRWALADAGYAEREFDRASTAVILGNTDAGGMLGQQLYMRSLLPFVVEALTAEQKARLPKWTGETFPGVLDNVIAGRIANHFDLGGPNYVVEAACASSLLAVELAVRELQTRSSNLVITGGVDTQQTPFSYAAFAQTHALSPRGKPAVFDRSADGIVISEGVCILILKRLDDAQRDRDRVYAVIEGAGSSSDGRGLGLTAPNSDGQRMALLRALKAARREAGELGLYEAHGTGTPLGDRTELETLARLLATAGARPASCAVGSVKSLIGHTKATAGAAGLVKAALSLHHRVIPPHAGAPDPIAPLSDPRSAAHIVSEPRPWLAPPGGTRCAAVSAFGFGGTNTSVVLREERHDSLARAPLGARLWPAELIVLSAPDRRALSSRVSELASELSRARDLDLGELGLALAGQVASAPGETCRLAVVAANTSELLQALASARAAIEGQSSNLPRHVLLGEAEPIAPASLAFLFPGQGSQYLDMLREPTLYFDELRRAFELTDRELAATFPEGISRKVFPAAAFSKTVRQEQELELTNTLCAQPAIGAASIGLFDLLQRLGVRPGMVAGHSYGELTALHVAGALTRRDFLRLSAERGRAMNEACRVGGGMTSVRGNREQVAALIAGFDGVWLTNHNEPEQVVLSGTSAGLERAREKLTSAGLSIKPLPVAGPFHSPLMAPACRSFAAAIGAVALQRPRLPVYSNLDGSPYEQDLEQIRSRLLQQAERPVEFVMQISRMVADGARTFVEVGPQAILSRFVSRILGNERHLSVSLDSQGGSLRGLLRALAELFCHGVDLKLDRLYTDRDLRQRSVSEVLADATPRALPVTGFWVNGTSARPCAGSAASIAEKSPKARAEPFTVPLPQSRIPLERSSMPASSSKPLSTNVTTTEHAGLAAPHAELALEAYRAYQETMRRFLALEEQALSGLLAALGARNDGAVAATSPAPASLPPMAPNGKAHHVVEAAAAPAVNGKASVAAESSIAPTLPAVWDGERLKALLLTVVSERTGYPTEMLSLDQDLEFDLGVDSIRRLEIMESLLVRLPIPADVARSALAGSTSRGRTLRQLANELLPLLETNTKARVSPPDRSRPALVAAGDCARSVPVAELRPLSRGEPFALQGAVVITDDALGVAPLLEKTLKSRGLEVVRLSRTELARPELLERRLREAPAEVGAILHLAPLCRAPIPGNFAAFRELAELEAKSLFRILRTRALELRANAAAGGLAVYSATLLGGNFGRSTSRASASPLGGSGVGLLKTLALEWPGVNARALDFPDGESPLALAEHLLEELMVRDEVIEVGYLDGQRTAFPMRRQARAPLQSSGLAVTGDWVVLASGGVCGITAEILLEIAVPEMRLVVLGRSPEPSEEPADVRALSDDTQLRRHFAEQARTSGTFSVEQVEESVRQTLRAREVRHNAERLRSRGVRLTYLQCDVRDPEAVDRAVTELRRAHGKVDALIHAAGIIEDAPLTEKAPASFDRVFDTKVDGAYLLTSALRTDELKLIVLFGSVAGRFGNAGQADYAAANEVLNRFGWWLSAERPRTRVLTINWGPWSGVGMATPRVQSLLRERGMTPIAVPAGAHFFREELRTGDAVEVIAGEGPWNRDAATPEQDSEARTPEPISGTMLVAATVALDSAASS
jgi:acyl transferase domain-containing protein/NAD(P)H-dependent flavin oxidoreductase YrpB (nitropropane dioxygenase family)/NAD(P)-dependent dehydrogenase (short-subunit alcohol dehydrogenase family)